MKRWVTWLGTAVLFAVWMVGTWHLWGWFIRLHAGVCL